MNNGRKLNCPQKKFGYEKGEKDNIEEKRGILARKKICLKKENK